MPGGGVRMSQCISCQRFTFQQASREWLDLGFGNCSLREKFVMYSARIERDCEHHSPADTDVTAKRIAWLEARKA